MRLSAEATLHLVEESFSCLKYSSWLPSQTTRAMVFNQSTERRMAILEDLSLQGMDVTYPKNLSSRIDTQHAELESAELESALLQNRDGVLISITNGLKLHNRQFRATIEGYKMSLQAQIKRQNEQNEQFKVRKSSIEFTMPYHKFSNGLFFPSSVML